MPIGKVLLRALASATVAGFLYAAYLWILEKEFRPEHVMFIVGPIIFLTMVKLARQSD